MNVTPSNVRVTILDQSLEIKVLETFTRIRSSGGAVYPSVWPSGRPLSYSNATSPGFVILNIF